MFGLKKDGPCYARLLVQRERSREWHTVIVEFPNRATREELRRYWYATGSRHNISYCSPREAAKRKRVFYYNPC